LFAVSGGEEYYNVDFVILPTRLYSVSGRVELPEPNANTRFALALASIRQPALALAMAYSERDGGFRLEGIPAGSYYVFASGPAVARSGQGAVLGAKPLFGRTEVHVEQNVEGVSIAVERGRSIATMLRHLAPTKAGSGCPSTVRVTLLLLEGLGAVVHRTAEVSLTKETMLDNLPPGHYGVTVSQLGENCYLARQGVFELTGAREPSHLVVLLTPGGSIHGQLSSGADPTGVAVVLSAVDPADGAAPVQIAFPDRESRFTFANLRPGRYRIAAEPSSKVTKLGWTARPGRMFEIDLPGGASTLLELPMAPDDKAEH
jgi:hypothetical protein